MPCTLPAAPRPRAALCLAAGLIHTAHVDAQDFSRSLATADDVFRDGIIPQRILNALDSLDPENVGLPGGFVFTAETWADYDSNVTLSEDAEGEFFSFNLQPTFIYTTRTLGRARNNLSIYYSPIARIYLGDANLNAYDHSGGIRYVYRGNKLTFNSFAEYLEYSGPDRLVGAFSEGNILRIGAGASYRIAPRTTLFATVSHSESELNVIEGDNARPLSDATLFRSEFGAFWSKSDRLAFGPSVLYERSDSDLGGKREAYTLNANATYAWTERIDLRATVGVGFANLDRNANGDNLDLRADVSLRYFLSERWFFNSSLSYRTLPSPIQGANYINDFVFRIAAERTLDRGSLLAGAELAYTDFDGTTSLAGIRNRGSLWAVFTGYNRPLANERALWSSSIRYSQSYGDISWERLEIRTGITVTF